MKRIGINLLAVITGYLSMAIVIMITFSLAYLILGPERSYQPRSWNVSTVWIILSIVVGLGGAWLGGKICIKIACNHLAPKYLIAWVVVLGITSAIMANQGDVEAIRNVQPSNWEAMQNSIQPVWLTWLNPLLGVLGVAVGSGLLNAGRGSSERFES